jgi:serine/threonine protein kinase
MINQQIGNYKFLSVLGEGGMAVVYLAENVMLGTRLAIKVLKEEFLSNKNIRSRFLDEAKKMVAVKHPNIVQVFDLIDTGETVAIVLEYVEGKTLKEYISEKGKLNEFEIRKIIDQILLALHHVHSSGFVHRDIKPSNFMITQNGMIKILDFGIAKTINAISHEITRTGTGSQIGTPIYMSPEQIKSSKDVDFRSDIYSLGIVLFELATGKKPFEGNNLSLFELQTKIVNEAIPKTESSWDVFIQKATAKEPDDRFQSCNHWIMVLNDKNKVFINQVIDYKDAKENKQSYFELVLVTLLGIAIMCTVIFFIYFSQLEKSTSKIEGNENVEQEKKQEIDKDSLTLLLLEEVKGNYYSTDSFRVPHGGDLTKETRPGGPRSELYIRNSGKKLIYTYTEDTEFICAGTKTISEAEIQEITRDKDFYIISIKPIQCSEIEDENCLNTKVTRKPSNNNCEYKIRFNRNKKINSNDCTFELISDNSCLPCKKAFYFKGLSFNKL